MCLFNKKNKIKPIDTIEFFKDIGFNYLIDEYFKFNNIYVNTKFDYVENKLCILISAYYKKNLNIYYIFICKTFNQYYNKSIAVKDVKKYTRFIFF